jgi:hypothetical protein
MNIIEIEKTRNYLDNVSEDTKDQIILWLLQEKPDIELIKKQVEGFAKLDVFGSL